MSALMNRKDDFNFSYQNLNPNFNPNSINTSLVSLISYYVFVILGVDADSFILFGGDPYYEQAENC